MRTKIKSQRVGGGGQRSFARLTAAKACRSRKWARSTRNLARLDWLKRHRNFDTPYAYRGHKSNSRGGERLTMIILVNCRTKWPAKHQFVFIRACRNREGNPTPQHYNITLPIFYFLPCIAARRLKLSVTGCRLSSM
jgi:hypothetical protein